MIAFLLLLLQVATYDQLTSVLVAPNLNAKTNQTLGANVYTSCTNDPGVSLDSDLFFEPWPANNYHVNVWYSDGTAEHVEVGVINPLNPSRLSATFLGSTGEDLVGEGNQFSPNGTPDRHIQLRGLAGIPTRVQIIGDPSGLWETPFNGSNWVIATKYGNSAGFAEACNSRAIYEMTKDCVARYAAYYKELVEGRVRSKNKEAERLKFYQFELRPVGVSFP